MSLHLLLEMAAEAGPDRVAIGSRTGQSISYGALLRAAQRAAHLFASQQGKRVIFSGLTGQGSPIALFGASMAGKPFTPLNYRLPDADLRRLLMRSAPATALCDSDMLKRAEGLEGIQILAMPEFLKMSLDGSVEPFESLENEDVAIALFTSGTTSEPKSAILRHENLTSYVFSTLEFFSAGEEEAALVSVPPYHIAGVSAILTSVYTGRRMVQLPVFTPEAWVETVRTEQVTHAMVVPTMLGRILDVIARIKGGLPSLRALSYGGGRMPVPVIERAMDLLPNVDFVNAYGLTETSSTIAILDPSAHRAARVSDEPHVRRRLSSVGLPLPTLELEVRDDDNNVLPANQVGQIWVRGDQISGEYEGRKVKQDDGWFPTNDAGWVDDGGFLYVEGRLDDVIVRGGENISPSEVEDVLRMHPAVEDVAVLGAPDDEWGEKVVAVVVVSAPPCSDELKLFVKDRLRTTRVPQDIIYRSSLPYNDSGKLLRRVLREEFTRN